MKLTNGILLLYHRPLLHSDATTILENIAAFQKHSHFRVWGVNTTLDFPSRLFDLKFNAIILHYSLVGYPYYHLSDKFQDYLKQSSSYKIAFFQDEFHHCKQRFNFLNRYKIDCVYTLVEPSYFKDTYQKYTNVPKLISHIPGYVSQGMVEKAQQMTLPDDQRNIDVGYRGRELTGYMGQGAQEKYEIAGEFSRRASKLGLKLDIETKEEKRIYGEAWYRFLANCKAVLGVEAGVSIFDVEDVVRPEYERLLALGSKVDFKEKLRALLDPWEDNIYYRTISPRHFEAAAFRLCQILFEGRYSGIMKPMVHYIPLKKDFSNFDEVIRMFRDKTLRRELTENAYRDLIASGRYSYQRFIECFDQELLKEGLEPGVSNAEEEEVNRILNRGYIARKVVAMIKELIIHHQFPGRSAIISVVRPIVKPFIDTHYNRKYGTGTNKK